MSVGEIVVGFWRLYIHVTLVTAGWGTHVTVVERANVLINEGTVGLPLLTDQTLAVAGPEDDGTGEVPVVTNE